MRIALDAMGSDRAPLPEVEGAVMAAKADPSTGIILVGNRARLEAELAKFPRQPNITLRHASEAVSMTDSPVQAVRQKKDASLLVGMRMVKHREADGIVSAGNTGAVQVAARIILGPIKGVARSAICQQIPTLGKRKTLLIDLGANVDCSARHLCEFAEMGVVYAERALGYRNPRVGLLNIGEETIKGNELSKTVHRYLKAANHINFRGNVEPHVMFSGDCDVVVCDGFIGNLTLKACEATAYFIRQSLERQIKASWLSMLGALLSRGAFRRLKEETDPNDMTGAPLLGVNGTVIIIHGGTKAAGVANAIRGARISVASQINEHIRREIATLRSSNGTPLPYLSDTRETTA
jgi:phosphate acyltransferase